MTEGYHVKEYGQPVKRYVQTMDLKDDPELIAEYKRRHSQEESWSEILAGIRDVGILDMQIFILGTRLVMIVETPVDFEWEYAMASLAHYPVSRSGKTTWPSSNNAQKAPPVTRNGR